MLLRRAAPHAASNAKQTEEIMHTTTGSFRRKFHAILVLACGGLAGPLPGQQITYSVIPDTSFDGIQNMVPDGMIHIVEGAGGNRDFDGGKATPRGLGSKLDQEDSATGTYDFAIRAAPVVV
jgi:hypothetical protein